MEFEIGQCIYRFKADFENNGNVLVKHVFEIKAIDPAIDPKTGKKKGSFAEDRYKFRCINDSNVLYRDGGFAYPDTLKFGHATAAGKCVHVMLEKDDEDKARELVLEHLSARVEKCRKALEDAEFYLSLFEGR